MSDIIDPAPVPVTIGGREVKLDYSLASLHWLTSKYPDLPEFLNRISLRDKETGEIKTRGSLMKPSFLDALADFVYAGLYVPDDEGRDTGGWTPFKVLRGLHMDTMVSVALAATAAFSVGLSTPGGASPSE